MSGTPGRRRRPPTTVSLEEGRALIAASEPEETLLQFTLQTARTHQWLAYHTRRSDRSDKGFYDVVAIHGAMMRIVVAELKSANGRTTDDQKLWAGAAGIIAARWRDVMPFRNYGSPITTAVYPDRPETWPFAYYEWRPTKADKDEILRVFQWRR